MAKTTPTTRDARPSNNTSVVLHPQASDPRLELFYLLGVLRGAQVENSVRIAELVNLLLAPAAPAEIGGE